MFGWLGKKRKQMGDLGEAFAVRTLKEAGYRIIECNFSCSCGEVDIIARDGNALVFVEVKLRTCGQFGSPEEAVDTRKLKRIAKTVNYYISSHKIDDLDIRFDIVCVEDDGSGHLCARHLINAADLSQF